MFAECDNGLFDGFRVDTEGRLWSSAGDGVHVFDPDGTLLGKFLVPEIVGNVTFGGTKRNRLYICGTTSIYSLFTFATGWLKPRAGRLRSRGTLSTGQRASSRICAVTLARNADSRPRLPAVGMTMRSA